MIPRAPEQRPTLKQIIERTDTGWGRAFDLFIQFLIVVSMISFSMETLPDLSSKTRDLLWYVEVAIVGVFTAEYLMRVTVADKKAAFVFSFFGIIDLLAILPFYVSSGLVDLRFIRALRLLRLVRALKLVRYNRAMRRFRRAFVIAKEEFALFLFASILVLFFAAVGIYYFENSAQPEVFGSVFASLWWAVATLTTVGYGDAYPVTVGGKIFTFVILMIGLGIVAIPAGLFASALHKAREEEG